MACLLLGCFGMLLKAQQRQRLLNAVRDEDEDAAGEDLAKGLQLLSKQNALHLAAEEGQLAVLSAVLTVRICQETEHSGGAADLLNERDASGRTPLFITCMHGHADCARFLIANGASRNIPDLHGNVALHMAALRGHLGLIFMLLSEVGFAEGPQTPSSVHVTNHAGLTPLHLAVWGRHSGAVQVLLQHGADINVKTLLDLPEQHQHQHQQPQMPRSWPVCVAGTTPLHMAAARGHVEISKIFLKTYYERVLEPETIRRGRPGAGPPAIDLAALDPRLQLNGLGKMPYQIARHLGLIPLSMLLRPTVSLALLFSEEERNTGRIYGPPSLKSLATEALNRQLASRLQAIMQAQQDPKHATAKQQQQQQPEAAKQQRQGGLASPASLRNRPRPAAIVLPPPSDAQVAGLPTPFSQQQQQAAAMPACPSPRLLTHSPAAAAAAAAAAASGQQPLSPSLLSPRTPNLQAGQRFGRAQSHSEAQGSSRPTVGEDAADTDMRLPGMVSSEDEPSPLPSQQPPSPMRPGQQGFQGQLRLSGRANSLPHPPSPGAVMRSAGTATASSALPAHLTRPSSPESPAEVATGEPPVAQPPTPAPDDGGGGGGGSAARDGTADAAASGAAWEGEDGAAGMQGRASRQVSRGRGGSRPAIISSVGAGGGTGSLGTDAGGESAQQGTDDGGASGRWATGTPGTAEAGPGPGSVAAAGAWQEPGEDRRDRGTGQQQGQQREGSSPLSVGRTGRTASRDDTQQGPASGSGVGEDGGAADVGAAPVAARIAAAGRGQSPHASSNLAFDEDTGEEEGVEMAGGGHPNKRGSPPAALGLGFAAVEGFEASCGMEEECGICLEAMPTIAVRPCNHVMCGPCTLKIVSSQLQKPSLCPFCRALIHTFSPAAGGAH